jgi:hypothetical protein
MLIAMRELTVRSGKQDLRFPIRLFAPEQKAAQEWTCAFEIDWPDRKMSMTATGIDAMQALVLALQLLGSVVYSSAYHQAGALRWEKQGDGYGLPIAATLRDLLQGHDAKFF